jgi:hypothetical protein
VRADDVKACLRLRWPDEEYLHIEEAPTDSSRQGRKLDVLVVAFWQSRGLAVDGVEIKVSPSDWKRELTNPAKADFWWKHVNRFWVAVPAKIAERVKVDIPPTWGLLACEPGERPVVIVRAPHHDRAPLPWPTTVGLLRAASDAGVNALRRAEHRGRDAGFKAGQERAERNSPDGAAKAALDAMRERVSAFEAASGLDISTTWNAKAMGDAARLVHNEIRDPGWAARSIAMAADSTENAAKRLLEQAREAKRLAAVITDALDPKDESEAA